MPCSRASGWCWCGSGRFSLLSASVSLSRSAAGANPERRRLRCADRRPHRDWWDAARRGAPHGARRGHGAAAREPLSKRHGGTALADSSSDRMARPSARLSRPQSYSDALPLSHNTFLHCFVSLMCAAPPPLGVRDQVVEAACVIELPELKGRERIGDKFPLFTLIDCEGA